MIIPTCEIVERSLHVFGKSEIFPSDLKLFVTLKRATAHGSISQSLPSHHSSPARGSLLMTLTVANVLDSTR